LYVPSTLVFLEKDIKNMSLTEIQELI